VGHLEEAENAFKLAVDHEPTLHRAWYNLGLLLAKRERLGAAIVALKKAEGLASSQVDYPYALATVQLRAGDKVAAREAAERALKLEPQHEAARQVLRAAK